MRVYYDRDCDVNLIMNFWRVGVKRAQRLTNQQINREILT